MYHGGSFTAGQLSSALDADDEELGKIYDSQVIARLPAYLRPVRAWVIWGAIGMAVRSLASLAIPYLVALGVDRFIQTKDVRGLNSIAILYGVVLLLVWGGQYLETLYLAYAGDAILVRLRTQMFDHLQRLSLGFFDRNKVGKVMSRVQNDVRQLQEFITADLLNTVISLLTLVIIAAAMFVMNVRLALLSFTVVPVLALVLALWQRGARQAFARVRRAIAVVNAQLQEGIAGVRVVQSLSREGVNLSQFDSVNRDHLNANIGATRLTSVMMPVVEVLTAVAMGLVIIYGGYQVLAGTMGVGVLLGFLLYVQRFFGPVLELVMEYTELQRAMVAGTRIFELLDIPPEITDAPNAAVLPPVRGEIRFHDVSFSYQPGVEVLHNINLTIPAGVTVALVGRTGAGKSSLVNLVARFYEVSRGKVTIDGYDVRGVTQESLRRQIGMVPQDPFLFSGTIEDNIRYGKEDSRHDDVVRAARVVGADGFISRLERGDQTPVGERGVNLSTGQRQLICLARAVLADPPILVFDEATSNIDTTTERLMQESLRRLTRGRTCLIIAHRLSTVMSADRIVVLDHGRVAEVGTHPELLARGGLYAEMFRTLSAPETAPW